MTGSDTFRSTSSGREEKFLNDCVKEFDSTATELKQWAVDFKNTAGRRPKPRDFKGDLGEKYMYYCKLKKVLEDRNLIRPSTKPTSAGSAKPPLPSLTKPNIQRLDNATRSLEVHNDAHEDEGYRRTPIDQGPGKDMNPEVREAVSREAKKRAEQLFKFGVTTTIGGSADLAKEPYRGGAPATCRETYLKYRKRISKFGKGDEPPPTDELRYMPSPKPSEASISSARSHTSVWTSNTSYSSYSDTTSVKNRPPPRKPHGDRMAEVLSSRASSRASTEGSYQSSLDLTRLDVKMPDNALPPAQRVSSLIRLGAHMARASSARKNERTMTQEHFTYYKPVDEYEDEHHIREGPFRSYVSKSAYYKDFNAAGNPKK